MDAIPEGGEGGEVLLGVFELDIGQVFSYKLSVLSGFNCETQGVGEVLQELVEFGVSSF